MKDVTRLIEVFGTRDRTATLLEQLRATPPEELDAEVGRQLREHGYTDARSAFIGLLGVAPLEHFSVLRTVFVKHFAH
jgi:hypothetical protein